MSCVGKTNLYHVDEQGVLYTKANGVPTVLIAYPSANTQTTYTMPNTVVDGFELAFSRSYYIKELVLSDNFIIQNVKNLRPNFIDTDWGNNLAVMIYEYTSISKISVNPTNEYYTSINGQIYNKEGTILYYTPVFSSRLYGDETETVLNLSENLTTISYGALHTDYEKGHNTAYTEDCKYKTYDKIVIPTSVTSIDSTSLELINGNSWEIVFEGNDYYELVDGKLVAKAS